MAEGLHFADEVGAGLLSFLDWLGIHPTLQDLGKAFILVLFVLAILMIVGDVYRGEIQNKLHRIRLAPSSKGALLPAEQRTELEARRKLRQNKDILCHVPQTLVPLTLNDIYSNVIFYFRYRDATGKLKSQIVETYKSRFYVKKNALPHSLTAGHEDDHKYSVDENDQLSDEDSVTTISMAASRVDYIRIGKIDPLLEKEMVKYEKLKASPVRQRLAGIKNGALQKPEPVGLAIKFHFPINPYFLLYRHPDTNVRTTAWLTVLTSVFALFMQLIYSGSTATATARQQSERPEIGQRTSMSRSHPAGPN